MTNIPVAGPSITDREIELVSEAARTAWYGNHYKYNALFEKMVAEYVGVRYAVAVPHCTHALHLALAGLGIGSGDEVIVPDVTWIASVAPVTYVGAIPILVDILPDTWCIDPDAVERAIGPKTKAIIGVDLYGSMCDWARLQHIADKHELFLIEDAAQAMGSEEWGARAGSFGDAATFSFHGSKTVATGEGGMLVTDNKKLFDRVLFLRDHGRDIKNHFMFNNTEIAFKYRMSAVTAALGVAQMERIDELVNKKRQIFKWYKDRLGMYRELSLNLEPAGMRNSFWMTTVINHVHMRKQDLMAELKLREIDSRPFFTPLSSLPAFKDMKESKRFLRSVGNPMKVSRYGVNLPSPMDLKEEECEQACQALIEILNLPASSGVVRAKRKSFAPS